MPPPKNGPSETNRTYKLHELNEAVDAEIAVAILPDQNVGRVHLLHLRLDFDCKIEKFKLDYQNAKVPDSGTAAEQQNEAWNEVSGSTVLT